jgi:hypothetical protein
MCNTEWGDIQAKLGQVFKRAFPNGPDRGNGRLLFYGLACLTWGESECDPACLTYPNPGSEAGNAWGWYQFIAEDWKQALQGAAAHTVDNSFLDWNKQKACKCHRGINTRAALSLVWQECSDHDTIFDALHRWDVARLPNIEPRKRWEQCLASKNITVQDLKAHACPQANAVLA